jgi:hypothetical protein
LSASDDGQTYNPAVSDLLFLVELILRLVHALGKVFGRTDDDWPLDRHGRDLNGRSD